MALELGTGGARFPFAENIVREALKSYLPLGSQILLDGWLMLTNQNTHTVNILSFNDTPEILLHQKKGETMVQSFVDKKENSSVFNFQHSGSCKRKLKKPIRLHNSQSEVSEFYDETGALNLSLKDRNQIAKKSFTIQEDGQISHSASQNHQSSTSRRCSDTNDGTNAPSQTSDHIPQKKTLKTKRRIFNRFCRSSSDLNLPRNFTCNQCKASYNTLSALGQHTTETHKFYRCVICNAQFTQRSNLQRHSLKHVGFKPFVCKLCNKAYYRKDHLMRHLEMSHRQADPQDSIDVKLTYSECLDYIDQYVLKKIDPVPAVATKEQNDLNKTASSSSGSEALSMVWESPSSDVVKKFEFKEEKMDNLSVSDSVISEFV